ncbi:nuclease-related domain-containing protein [Fictibacillus sp. FJAT-27399]|uniref:nuclease-related domain-containing protein n=1 Tax=Fictibacillus sp. FJAT-27399 TaxID=1729689 RepID=UPI000783424F|nr:nuclease-related domain-containing protein [Fictibacillus sp. FJAT-27399]
MIEQKLPIYIQKLEALLRRLPANHPKRPKLEQSFSKQMAGYKGERSLFYYLEHLPHKRYKILHGLRLLEGSYYFQMDFLILSPYFFLILEVKNLSGSLTFDTNYRQLIRTNNDKEEAFSDPLLQVERQKNRLSSWLAARKLPPVPIETLVVVSSPYTLIKNPLIPDLSRSIIHSSSLPSVITTMQTHYAKPAMTDKEINRAGKQLYKNHVHYDPDILAKFQVSPNDVLKGVHCPSCFAIGMNKTYAVKWLCPFCNYSSEHAHRHSLEDYKLLISPTITNRELRSFLSLSSRSISEKILKSLNLPHTRTYKDRRYHL